MLGSRSTECGTSTIDAIFLFKLKSSQSSSCGLLRPLYPSSTAEQQKQLVIKTQLLHYSVLIVIQDTENGSKLSYF